MRRHALWMILALAAYALLILWFDRKTDGLATLGDILGSLALAAGLVFLSYVFRYQRWRWLFGAHAAALPWGHGLLAYLAGFALTVSPGKAGELLRIRYFRRFGVPAQRTFDAFVCERSLDLLVVAALGGLAASLSPLFVPVVAIVITIVLALTALARADGLRHRLHRWLGALRWRPLRVALIHSVDATAALRLIGAPRRWLIGMAFGAPAWLLTSLAFLLVCAALGIVLPWPLALGIYPLAMLVGAFSFLPGGIGATEAAIVLMLQGLAVPLELAAAAAIGSRLASLWFAMAVGLLCVAVLELRGMPSRPVDSAPR
jgi:glycosyltransferase 2 family protein